MMWLLCWFACFGDAVTSETSFAGRLVDAAGAPVEGLTVRSIAAQSRTAADGTFQVQTSPESGLVHFTRGATWYRQTRQPAHAGTVVPLALPETADRTVGCPPVDCNLTLSWDLGGGFSGQVSPSCTPGGEVAVSQVPVTMPTVACTQGKGTDRVQVPVEGRLEGARIVVGPRSTALTVTVDADPAPTDCQVQLGERVAPEVRPGAWAAEVSGPVTVVVRCAGVPAVPVRVDPGETPEVSVSWQPDTPTLALGAVAPWASELVVAAESPEAGWSLRLVPDASGTVVLPPLARGPYRLMLRSERRDLPLVTPPPRGAPGVATFGPDVDETRVGRLNVDAPLASGPVRVSVAP